MNYCKRVVFKHGSLRSSCRSWRVTVYCITCVQWIYQKALLKTPFLRLRRHYVSGAKPYVCSVKARKVGFWLGIKCGSWCHVFMFLSSPEFWLINEIKNGNQIKNLSRDISFRPLRSNRIFCSKSLAAKFDVKYLFTT